MTALLGQAALWVAAFGLISAVCAAIHLRQVQPVVALLADFLLAAGLIRLAGEPSWDSLALAASTGAVRLLLGAALRHRASGIGARRGGGGGGGSG
ncbi:hypothetical protein ABZ649_29815 [Streptomyces albidoflavus]|jgi:hypothetical protein|uniref:Uncharacterized protein n=2 Tax=Streptomyces TaxID=1883 RepID=A0A7L5XI58_9ACTN|nr:MULTISPECIES: hypothetical protein [Streptomyces]MYX53531.1 hypothetical protein [Streptomyces sp. SID8385]MYX87917.1 hypothetical protein [Streptomyces sp. SID4915]NVI30993.1 hypothetical protein [Streptomyces sp. CAI-17]BDH49307.1 hypothetical protein MTP02_03180 [Streptomyces albus]AGI86712.1 Hypothetical protein XNR_0309 [Streptomyces albidoflavus]